MAKQNQETILNDSVIDIIYHPAESASRAEIVIEGYQSGKGHGIATYSPIDKHLKPIVGAQFGTILAYTSNGKSTLMNHIARQNAMKLTDPDEIVVTFLFEQAIEEIIIQDVSATHKVNIDELVFKKLSVSALDEFKRGLEQRKLLPWWLVGHSLLDRKSRPRMSTVEIRAAMDYIIEKLKMKPVLMFIDYIQRIRLLKPDIREGFIAVVDDLKDFTFRYGIPEIAASQSGRQVAQRGDWQMPRKDDSQETSNIEQSSNWMLGLFMPKNNMVLDDPAAPSVVKHGNRAWRVTENLLLYQVLKQTWGTAGTGAVGGIYIDYNNYGLYGQDALDLDEIEKLKPKKKYERNA